MRLSSDGLLILIAGVTSEVDALLAVGLGASGVCFDFGPTPWHVDPTEADLIMRRLPQGVITVGMFRNEQPQRIVEVTNKLGLSAAMLYGVMSQAEIDFVSNRVATVLRAVPEDSFVTNVDNCDYLVVPEVDSLEQLQENADAFFDSEVTQPLVIGGGLTPEIITEAVQTFPVSGVVVLSGVEVSPGEKDPVRMAEFIAKAKWAYENPFLEGN